MIIFFRFLLFVILILGILAITTIVNHIYIIICNYITNFCKLTNEYNFYRLVSAYEDKVLGLSENGEIFGVVKNKTFPEFVDHVLKEWKHHSCNEHWEPQYMHCDYCDIRYDIIGRVENLERDLEYIASVNNFTSDLHSLKDDLHMHPSGTKRFERPRKKVVKTNTVKGKMEKTIRYFTLLNSTQVGNLYRMYEIDFEIFGYSTEPYHKEKFL